MKVLERFIYIGVIIFLVWVSIARNGRTIITTLPGDTIYSKVNIDRPVPYDTTIYDVDTLWLPSDTVNIHDTVFIYNDYFKMYKYKVDTNISEVDLIINTNITQNRLYSQSISAKNNRETKIISDQSNLIGIGGTIGLNNFIAPMVSYQFKQHEIGLGYNIVGSRGMIVSYEYKIKLK